MSYPHSHTLTVQSQLFGQLFVIAVIAQGLWLLSIDEFMSLSISRIGGLVLLAGGCMLASGQALDTSLKVVLAGLAIDALRVFNGATGTYFVAGLVTSLGLGLIAWQSLRAAQGSTLSPFEQAIPNLLQVTRATAHLMQSLGFRSIKQYRAINLIVAVLLVSVAVVSMIGSFAQDLIVEHLAGTFNISKQFVDLFQLANGFLVMLGFAIILLITLPVLLLATRVKALHILSLAAYTAFAWEALISLVTYSTSTYDLAVFSLFTYAVYVGTYPKPLTNAKPAEEPSVGPAPNSLPMHQTEAPQDQ